MKYTREITCSKCKKQFSTGECTSISKSILKVIKVHSDFRKHRKNSCNN